MILCYFHYIVGIVYAFVVTHNNRYADRYEDKEVERIARIKAEVKKEDDETPTDIAFYIGLVIGVFTFVGLIYLILRFS
jgi:NAD/NADP transhydrogenase beta subunit